MYAYKKDKSCYISIKIRRSESPIRKYWENYLKTESGFSRKTSKLKNRNLFKIKLVQKRRKFGWQMMRLV